MDQQPNIPSILPSLNREKEKKEAKRGGLAGLLSRLGFGSKAAGGAGGVGGAGGLSGLGSLGLGGGILATKAGIIGLALVATTVAGSIGMVGYKLFGPTSADRTDADFSSLFASKPRGGDGSAEGQGGSASASGASKSLDFLVQANTGEPPAPVDENAAAPAAPPEASASVTPPPLVNNNAPGQGAAARLKSDRKFGQLTQRAASGSGGTASIPATGAGTAGSLGSGAKSSLAAMSKSPSAKAGRGANALRSGVRRLGAYRQLSQVGRDHRGAQSSAQSGRTYDNSAPKSASPGAADGTLGATESAPDSNTPVNPSNASSPEDRFVEPPAAAGTNVTPWQAAINTSLLLVMLSAGLLFAASKIQGMAGLSAVAAKGWIIALASLAALAALAVVGFGSMIGGGKYGQPLQGQLLSVAGGCLLATAAILIVSVAGAGSGNQVKAGDVNPDKAGTFYDKAGADKANAAASEAALSSAMGGSTQILMMCCGGAALAAAAWAYMAPAKQYDGSLFKDGRPPDWDNPYQSSQVVRPPSQGILDRYLA